MKIEIYILPNAKKTEYAGLHDNRPKIKISSPPIDNSANEALVNFLSTKLGVAKSNIQIVRGDKTRFKLIEIDTQLTLETVLDKISR